MRSSISAQSCASVPPAAGLDVDEGAVRIHLAREHALELEFVDARGLRFQIVAHGDGRALVVFGDGHVEQFAGFGQRIRQAGNFADDLVEQSALATQFLRPRRVVPDARQFEFAGYFFEAFALGLVVKGTP
jgi:prepilin-type processing-associated H-X9-DG protein